MPYAANITPGHPPSPNHGGRRRLQRMHNRITNWQIHCLSGAVQLGADAADLDALRQIAERLQRRAREGAFAAHA